MQTHQADARTDLYGMGAIAYFLLTGQPPFVSDDAMTVMVAHARDPVVPPSRLRSGVPDDLEKIVLRCLEKNPGARFQDARSLAEALDCVRRCRRLVGRASRPLVAELMNRRHRFRNPWRRAHRHYRHSRLWHLPR